MGRRVLIDAYTRCSCGHIMGLHSATRPSPCRDRDCGCDGFYLVRGSRTITMLEPPPSRRDLARQRRRLLR